MEKLVYFFSAVFFATNILASTQPQNVIPQPESVLCDDLPIPEATKGDRWLMASNWNDKTTREGLLKVFEALSTRGVVVQNIFGFLRNDNTFYISFEFNPSKYYPTDRAAEQAKTRMLDTLIAIEGISVVCDTPMSLASPQ